MWVNILLLPVALFLIFYLTNSAKSYEFDLPNNHGSFFPVYQNYSRMFYVVMVLGIALAGVALGYVREEHIGVSAAACLFISAIFALLTNGSMMFFYENYLHVKYLKPAAPSPYSREKYATVCTLGFSSIILFIIGACGLFAAL